MGGGDQSKPGTLVGPLSNSATLPGAGWTNGKTKLSLVFSLFFFSNRPFVKIIFFKLKRGEMKLRISQPQKTG